MPKDSNTPPQPDTTNDTPKTDEQFSALSDELTAETRDPQPEEDSRPRDRHLDDVAMPPRVLDAVATAEAAIANSNARGLVTDDTGLTEAQQIKASYEAGHGPKRGLRPIGHTPVDKTPRTRRLEKYTYTNYYELARQAERDAKVSRGGLSDEVYDALWERAFDYALRGGQLSAQDRRVMEKWTKSSLTDAEAPGANEKTVMAAVLRQPELAWFMARLANRVGTRGPEPSRRLSAASTIYMGFSRGRPEIKSAMDAFGDADPHVAWAFEYPNDPAVGPQLKKTQVYAGIHDSLHVKNLDVELGMHLQVALFRRFAEQEVTNRLGNRKRRHPLAGHALVVDGSFTEGVVEQCLYRDERERQALIGGREDKDGIRKRVYGDDGFFTSKVVGYRFVALVCAATGRCVISTLIPADGDEVEASEFLLEKLFEIWPDCPAEYIVGDGIYGHSEDYLRRLMFKWGLIPVFPRRADYPTPEGFEHGVPLCYCGVDDHGNGTPVPMVFKQWKDRWYGPENRLAEDIKRGEWAPVRRMRMEFECPTKTCDPVITSTSDKLPGNVSAMRIFTMLPHIGDSHKASLRRVLLRQRNIVESFYASMQRLGNQARGVNRGAWANDVETSWILTLGAIYLTAKRLVHENGDFDRANDEAMELGLLTPSGEDNPAPGPTALQLAAAKRARAAWVQPTAPPESWIRLKGSEAAELTGSGSEWADRWAASMAA